MSVRALPSLASVFAIIFAPLAAWGMPCCCSEPAEAAPACCAARESGAESAPTPPAGCTDDSATKMLQVEECCCQPPSLELVRPVVVDRLDSLLIATLDQPAVDPQSLRPERPLAAAFGEDVPVRYGPALLALYCVWLK